MSERRACPWTRRTSRNASRAVHRRCLGEGGRAYAIGHTCLVFLASLWCFPSGASAQTVVLDPVVVTAPEQGEPEAAEANPSRFVEVIDAKEAMLRVESAADLVEDAAGVRIRRYGGFGSYSTISLRGSSPTQVPVLLDGVPIADAHSGLVNLEDLPVQDLDRIEIYRGFAPVEAADAGIGGAVNIVTRAAPSEGPLECSTGFSAGSFGTYRAYASGASTLGDCAEPSDNGGTGRSPRGPCPGLRLTAGHARSAGDFAFRSDRGTPLDAADDESLERINNDFAQTATSARLAIPFAEWSLDGSASFVAVDRGLPGLDYHQAERSRLSGTATRLRVAALAPALGGGVADVRAGAYGSVRTDRFEDPAGEIGVGSQIEDDLGAAVGAFAAASFLLGGGAHALETRVEMRHESFFPGHELPEAASGPTQSRWFAGLGAAYEASLADDALVLAAGARADLHLDEFAGDPRATWARTQSAERRFDVLVSPSAGVRWAATEWLDVKANGGWFHRLPSFSELFGDRGTVVGNAALVPESAANVDAGVSAAPYSGDGDLRLRVDAAFYMSFAEDLIIFVPQSQSVFRAENVGAARIIGVETTMRLAYARVGALEVAYTWQDARDTSDTPYWSGRMLPGRAEHDLAMRASGTFGPVDVWYELDYLAGNYLDRANMRFAPSRLLHGAGATLRWRFDRYEIAAAVEAVNLGDAEVYDAFRYPLPGRAVFGSVRIVM